jgi:hypothetical protein
MSNPSPISALRVAYKYLTRIAYEEGYKNPDGLGWENGEVEGIQFSGQGSLMPPVRDGKGDRITDPPVVGTDGVTPLLSKNIPPGSPKDKRAYGYKLR